MYWLGLVFLLSLSVQAETPELTVYTYDSFVGPGTLGEFLAKDSLALTGCQTQFRVFPTAGEALSQLALEGDKSHADVVLGVDQTLLATAIESKRFEPWDVKTSQGLDSGLLFDASGQWLPFDYGFLSVVYDDRRKNPPPAGMTLKQFSEETKYRKRLVLEDPRTSSLGRSLLVWTDILFSEKEAEVFWKNIFQQTLTVAPGWSASYGLFLNKEADFVFSYTTSPAYHIENEKHSHIRAMIFPEGNYRQVEMVGRVKNSPQKACAEKWVQRLLSAEGQSQVALRQWMYPARKGVPLPASFQGLPPVKKVLDEPVRAARLGSKELKMWMRRSLGGK